MAEAKGDLAGAAKAYERMGQEAPQALADRADWSGRGCWPRPGKADEARQLLEPVRRRTTRTPPLAGQAAQRLAQLGAK